MVAYDSQAAAEAEELIPNVATAAVKETISRSAVKCLTPEKAGRLLKEQTAFALRNKDKVKPLTPPDEWGAQHRICQLRPGGMGEPDAGHGNQAGNDGSPL